VPTIDLTTAKDPARVLRNAVEPNINPKGTFLVYHIGDYLDAVNNTAVGRMAWQLQEAKRVRLFQKVIEQEPRRYAYIAQIV
jgi:hypothetical protein